MRIVTINDNNTRFDLVVLKDACLTGRKTPHCKKHGAMNKVSEVYWRCLYPGCRAGCMQK